MKRWRGDRTICEKELSARATVDNLIVLEVVSGTTPTHEDIQRSCDAILASGSVSNVVVDFSDVEFVSSSFLARLAALNKRIRAADRRYIFCGLRPVVREIFRVSRLDTILDIAEDKDTVLTSLRSLRLANELSQILDRESGLTWRRAIPLLTDQRR